MPKLVCVNCQTELRCETSGTTVVDMADFGIYKVWDADTYKCPGCGNEVVTGFGERPMREHYETGFDEWWNAFKFRACRIVYNYERPIKLNKPEDTA